jgi:hypothetical protein
VSDCRGVAPGASVPPVDPWVNAPQFAAIEASLARLAARWPHRPEIATLLKAIRRNVAYRAADVPEAVDELTRELAGLHAALINGTLDEWIDRVG